MTEYGRMRYNLLGSGGHWFPGLNAAKAGEHDLAAIGAAAGLDDLADLLRQTHEMLGGEEVKRLSSVD
jgi:predicted aldo/keto reductase-like oxidoreductase